MPTYHVEEYFTTVKPFRTITFSDRNMAQTLTDRINAQQPLNNVRTVAVLRVTQANAPQHALLSPLSPIASGLITLVLLCTFAVGALCEAARRAR